VEDERDRASDQRPIIVVATQCIEVGADFDFDAMLIECAPLDSLRQRLGRLDRLGEVGESPVIIFADRADLKVDVVYGPATEATWKWLNDNLPPKKEWKKKGQPRVLELGTASSLYDDLSTEQIENLTAPSPHAPVLLPTHLDLLSQTSPVPGADPDPAFFLHGPDVG